MTCQCASSSVTNAPSCGGVDSGGGWAGDRTGGIWETSVLSPQFCCEPTTALKK